MKKVFFAIAAFAACVLMLQSCAEIEGTFGTVWYTYGFSNAETSDTATMQKIIDTYKAEFKTIVGADNKTDGKVGMEGTYTTCDKRVKNACAAAEKKLAGVSVSGKLVFHISASYSAPARIEDGFYLKSFGE